MRRTGNYFDSSPYQSAVQRPHQLSAGTFEERAAIDHVSCEGCGSSYWCDAGCSIEFVCWGHALKFSTIEVEHDDKPIGFTSVAAGNMSLKFQR